MIDTITVETQQYAHRDKNDFYISSSEIYQFLVFLLFTGYHSLPSERDYWSSQPDLHVSFIANEMTRNRYLKKNENFHLADNENLQKGNKVAKVKPLYGAFNASLKKFGVLHDKLSIDESQ